ncbi:MAG TPA: cupin domain-containing protein [Chroococcales cyanobacterium]
MTLKEMTAEQPVETISGTNFTCSQFGKFSQLTDFWIQHPRMQRKAQGKVFLKDYLNLTGMQVSLNKLPAGRAVPFAHRHRENEELYIFIGGKGQMQIDGEIIEITEGTCIRVSPNGSRTWRNNSSEDLYYVVVQAKDHSLSIDTFDDGLPDENPVVWPTP